MEANRDSLLNLNFAKNHYKSKNKLERKLLIFQDKVYSI